MNQNAEKRVRKLFGVFGMDTAEAGVDVPETFIKECGLPTKMRIEPKVLRQVADIRTS